MTATRHVLDCARARSNPEGPPRYVPPALCIGPITIFSTKAAAGAAGPPPPPRRRQRRWRQGQRGHHQYRGGGDGASGGSTKFGCQVSRNSYLYSTSTQPLEWKCKVNMQPEPTVLRFVVENNIDATCKTETGKQNRTTLPRLTAPIPASMGPMRSQHDRSTSCKNAMLPGMWMTVMAMPLPETDPVRVG